MSIKELIQLNEKRYNDFLMKATEDICSHNSLKMILVAGPSCSGKTTSTHLLARYLTKLGKTVHIISIDDFYKEPIFMPKKKDGKPDYEDIRSFDTDLLHKCLHTLSKSELTSIPKFDFTIGKRNGIRSIIVPDESSIVIIEGLHALNPLIYKSFVPEDSVYKIYLDCYTQTKSYMRYPRLMRRLVRDYLFRHSNAENTFYLWDNVLEGERKYIYPFEDEADLKINTYFEYEQGVLKPFLKKVLGTVSTDSQYASHAKAISEYIENISEISQELVPKDSLLREFVG